MAETKRVSAFRNAGLKKNRITKKETKERASAFREDEKNKGGLLEGAGYLAGNLGLGAAGIAEGIGDVLSAGGDLLRGDTAMAKYRFLDNQTADAQRKLQESYNPGTIMKGAGDVASGIGNSLVFMIPYAGPWLAGAGFVGQGISNAAEKTGDVGLKEIGYGVLSGGMEFGLEAATAGIGGVAKNIGASVIRNTGKEAVEATGKAIGRRAVSTMGGSIGKEIAKGFFGEAIEEMASEALDPVLQRAFKVDENAETSLENVLYAGLIGGLSGGLMTAGPAAINYASAKKTGQTIREKGEAQELLDYAKLLVNGATRFASKSAPKAEAPEGAGKLRKAATGVKNAATGVNRWWTANGATRLANTLQKNISAYEAMLKDPKVTADKIKLYDAVLGELRGNTFLLEADYLLDTYEDMILKESEENRQAVVNEINERMARSGAPKRDYTLEDLKNNEDGILTSYATAIMREEISDVMKKRTGKQSPAKAPEAAEEAPKAAEAAPDVQTPTQNQKPAEREFEGDEGILRKSAKGLGLSDVETDMMVTAFKRGTSMDEDTFSKAFAEGVYYGRQNRRAEDVSKNTLLGTMSEAERSAAIEAGRIGAKADTERRAALAAQKTAPAPKEPERVRLELKDGIPMKQRGDRAYSVYNASKIIGSALNADVVIHDTLGEKNGRKLNGYFNRKDNTMHLALDAGKDGSGTALYTLAHEATHYVREWSPEKYQVLADFIGQRMSARGEDLDAMIATKKELLKNMEEFKDLSDSALTDAAYEEVISDAMETVLSDGKVLQELADRDKSLWEKVKAWIREAIARLKAAYAELKPNSQAAKVLKETMTSMEEIERLFTEGVTAAGERTKGAETGAKTETSVESAKYSLAPNAKDEVKKALKDKNYRDEILLTDSTPKLLLGNKGVRDLPMTMNASHVRENIFEESEAKKNGFRVGTGINYHGLGEELFFKVIEDLENATEVYRGTKNAEKSERRENYFLLISQHKDKDGNVINVPVYINEKSGHNRVFIDANKIATVFGRDGLTDYIRREVAKGNLIRVRTKKGSTQASEGTSAIEAAYSEDTSDSSIPQSEDSVNSKFSISEENVSEDTAEAPETAADTNVGDNEEVSDSPFEQALRRAGLSHILEETSEAENAEIVPSTRREQREFDPEKDRSARIQAHETLANALMEAVQNEHEFRLVKNYQQKAAELADAEVRKEDLRKKTAEVNREIEALQGKLRGVDKTKREPWIMTALTDAQKRKGELLDEMDALDEKLRAETDKLLSIASAKQLRKMIRDERSKAAAMERSAERSRQREKDSKEWAANTVRKIRKETNERIARAEQDARDYKAAIHKTSMDRVYKANREAREYKTAVYHKAYEKANEKSRKYKEKLDRLAGESRERGEITARKRTVSRVLGTLETKLYHPTKNNHVPQELQELALTTLRATDPEAFSTNRKNLREIGELAGKIESLERKAARTANEQATLDKMKAKYEHLEAEMLPLKKQAEALMTAFVEYNKKLPESLQYPDGLLNIMTNRVKEIESVPLSAMGLRSIEAVETFVTMLSKQVEAANNTFATKKVAKVDDMSTEANQEVVDAKELKVLSPKGKEWKGLPLIRKFLWGNMKPLTFFEAIGSKTLQELFQNVIDGEDVWARDLMEAHEFLEKAKKEYGYNKWDMDKRSEVKTAGGETVSLTLGEKMSLYAYMFREQAEQHLSVGGFTFAPDATTIENFKNGAIKYEAVLNDQKQYRMRQEDIAEMAASLTAEQKEYARKVQEYLTSLGKKGNEVSKKLYGIELFNEQFYFPIRSNRDYLAESTGKSGDPNIKNRGTFKETVPGAGNPIVLEDFMTVVAGHINNMATYHAFVLPVEDLTKVWNYTPVNMKRDENGEVILDDNGLPVADEDAARSYNSLKAEITKKYGKEANEYILNLIRDLNGGARRDAAASILDQGITGFKRATTMLSMSTIIQQPTSVFRAMSLIDGKYFAGAELADWEEMKKLAPVAFLKEMGGHDTSTGARTQDYLNAKEYDSIGDKVKAALKPKTYGGDPKARAEAFGWLTSKADEVAWRLMFGACINEQTAKMGKPKDSKEVKEAAAKRFTEVVRKTQVYDSTLTRSPWMRSKDGLMKIVTSFSAEPTTVMSMIAEGIIKRERGDKKALRTIGGAVALSVLANAIASSLIYAMRDDDEDETYAEKYLQSLTSEVIEGINPLEYMPVARDVMSLFKGYEIERTDMTLVSNLFEQVEMITSSKRSFPDKLFGVSGAVAAFFGVPLTNVYRDAKGLFKTIMGFQTAESQTGAGFKHAVGDSVRSQFNLFSKLFGAESGNAYEMYQAYVRGDTAHYERVKARYESDTAAEQALRKELRENDKRIGEAAKARLDGELEVYESLVEQIEAEGIFDRNIVIRAVNNEILLLKSDIKRGNLVPEDPVEEETPESIYTASDLNDALERGEAEDFTWIYHTLMAYKQEQGKTEAQAKASIKTSVTSYWKKRYTAAWEENNSEEMRRILKLLLDTGLYGNHNATATTLEGWVKAYAKNKSK